MRNISFSLTTAAVRERRKTVTRRRGWLFLKPGDLLQACDKCMGQRPGQRPEKLAVIRVVDVRRESLARLLNEGYGRGEALLEGFRGYTGSGFHRFFCQKMKAKPDEEITRIRFEYLSQLELKELGLL